MKKYLKDLETELRKNNLNEKEIEEILADHQEMIESAISEGLTDDELTTKFGNPKDVAEELSGFTEHESKKEIEDKIGSKESKKALVFNNIKDNYRLNIALVNEDVKIQLIDEDFIKVQFVGKIDADKYEIKYEKNEFVLKSPKRIINSYFGLNGHKEFILNLPKSLKASSLKAKLINGDLQIKSFFSNEIILDTNNGDIKLSNISSKEFKLGVVNGDVSIEKVICDNFKTSAISGDLDIRDLKVKGDIFANTVSGDIKIKDSECSSVILKTVSGDIKANEFYPKKISLSSISGDIKIVNTDANRPIVVTSKRSISGDIDIILK